MSVPHRTRGVKVLKAVSSPLRLQILNFLYDKNALSYSELMNALKMNPSRDAGRFAYHLKFLLRTNLVEADVDSKKYYLTDLGKMIIDVADRVEKNAQKPKTLLVRTSHSTLEEFDSNKIANSLIKEAKMPPDQAQKIGKETEKLLEKSKTKYVTAPLIRELVNALLIEKGQEHYRHRLTRLGLPVYEVTTLLESKDNPQGAANILTKAGQAVFNEYAMLNILPRDVADAHASGAIHINGLSTWLLKPNNIIHDLRFFLQTGLKPIHPLRNSQNPPATLESALTLAFNVLLNCSLEVKETQTLEHFNLFLAPFTRNVSPATIKENLRLFVHNLNQNLNAAIGLDLITPKFIIDKSATGPEGKRTEGCFDFVEESLLIAELLIEIITEENMSKPLLNPALIIEINKDALIHDSAQKILLKAHNLASEKGVLYFANTTTKEGKHVSFSVAGNKFEADITGDSEADTLRTGCIGMVTINLPRIVLESEREKIKFFEILKERYELAMRALEIKMRMLRQYERTVLPFIAQNANGDRYFRLESCSSLINFAGLRESVDAFCEGKMQQDKSAFMSEIIQNIVNLKVKMGRKRGKRFFPVILQSLEASERLAQLDIEKYGVAKVKFLGTKDRPYYSTSKKLNIPKDNVFNVKPESLEMVQKLKLLNQGGNLLVIDLEQTEFKPEDLMTLTKQFVEKEIAEFFTYNRVITFCNNCGKNWFGRLHKCPTCNAITTLIVFDRFDHS
ncbi:MAG TPA: anaerobic ribonucleoside-triphosphate reductase [Candidatus Sulfotelmatobacter sp.]|nr:anaerobic ribonucleoside-triphosphate reductase [Candidatus Sulfotelmatobacter sp.]